ncbi:hypothetical protein AXF42_Ash005613 [Apostasia shenzhenica]|uniref:Uncharacterized protein n=1 Tax=Apostasia shenzhenica TaxID=1088818 RepID=A0A2I0BBX6_9ASPA|nr:hypothetical protein AXF42_Ash005613 [Apostasia shenzhenica]
MVRIWKMKEGSFSTRSPISMRRRITAPQIMQCRKINSEETQSDSGFISETSCAHKEAMSPSSPQAKLLEFKTPESMNKRRRHGLLFSMRERELLSPPDFTSDSPSSVLDPPPSSSKRKTIRDYFTAS